MVCEPIVPTVDARQRFSPRANPCHDDNFVEIDQPFAKHRDNALAQQAVQQIAAPIRLFQRIPVSSSSPCTIPHRLKSVAGFRKPHYRMFIRHRYRRYKHLIRPRAPSARCGHISPYWRTSLHPYSPITSLPLIHSSPIEGAPMSFSRKVPVLAASVAAAALFVAAPAFAQSSSTKLMSNSAGPSSGMSAKAKPAADARDSTTTEAAGSGKASGLMAKAANHR